MLKKVLSIIVTLSMCFSLSIPAFAAEEDSYVDEIKRSYQNDFAFYQITDADYLDSLDDDEVIEVFHNINVTKRLLNDDMVLDINKVTEDDVVPELSPQSANMLDTETRHTLSASQDNVVVIKKCVAPKGPQITAPTTYITYAYLSNKGINDFIIKDWQEECNLGTTLRDTVANWIIGIVSAKFSSIFTIVTGVGQLGSVKMEKNFRNSLVAILDSGKKAKVTMTTTSRTCTKWSDRYFYTEDGSRNGLDFSSTYSTYSNKK